MKTLRTLAKSAFEKAKKLDPSSKEAVSEGVRDFRAICVVGGPDGRMESYTPPCGVCRQVMMEFCDPEEFEIILATGKEDYKIYKLKELIPLGFGPEDLA